MRRSAALLRGAAALMVSGLVACATSAAFRAGEQAERRQDYDRALLEYARAAKADPDNVQFQKSLERARLRAAEQHALAGRRLAGRGQYSEALAEYRLALELNPNAAVAEEARQVDKERQAGVPAPTVDLLKQRARETSLPGLTLGPEAREPLGLSFRNASLREVYQALGKTAGINFVFDPQFQDQPVTLDLRDVPFEQALNAVATVGHTFHRVLDSRSINVIPDTPSKRREFEQQVVKTFFLSNADLKETIDLLRIVLGARRVAPVPGANALTINDAPDKVAAAERIVDIVDKQRAEVVVDVEIMEVNRNRLKEYGIEITSPGQEGIAGAVFPDITERFTLKSGPYQPHNLIASALPGIIYRLLEADSSTRILANPQLRTTEGQTAQARFGDQIPVPVTVFTPIAAGGTPQQPVTSFEYKNVGVNIDITPRVHHDGDVTLNLKLEISSLGALFQSNPTFRSRTVTSVIRLHDGETNVLAGLISDDERTSFSGLPGVASVPVLGKALAHNRKETVQTDIIMTLTPRIVRRMPFTEEDLRSFTLGGESTPLLFDVPPAPLPSPSPHPESPRVEPIRPPAPVPGPSPSP